MKINSGTHYHLYNRGNNKDTVFFENDNYIYFLNLFKRHLAPHRNVLCYCLMPKHFHFFIKVNEKTLFEKEIKDLFIAYVKAINKKYNRVGSLFQGRYKVSEITSDNYFTTIITYIHQNPVVAGLVKNMKDYKYSSYNAYVSAKATMLNKEEALEWFGGLEGFIDHHKIALNEKEINKYLKIK